MNKEEIAAKIAARTQAAIDKLEEVTKEVADEPTIAQVLHELRMQQAQSKQEMAALKAELQEQITKNGEAIAAAAEEESRYVSAKTKTKAKVEAPKEPEIPEETTMMYIDLAECQQPALAHGNRLLLHGATYEVPLSESRSIMEMINRGKFQSAQESGKNTNALRRPYNRYDQMQGKASVQGQHVLSMKGR